MSHDECPAGPVEPPVAPLLARQLRLAVLEHRLRERRLHHPPAVWVGEPGGVAIRHLVTPGTIDDHALRADVVAALLHARRRDGVRHPWVWLTRPGPLDLEDVDAAWLASALTAFGEARLPLTMVVVDRHGWWDPRSGARRRWRRLRPRSRPR